MKDYPENSFQIPLCLPAGRQPPFAKGGPGGGLTIFMVCAGSQLAMINSFPSGHGFAYASFSLNSDDSPFGFGNGSYTEGFLIKKADKKFVTPARLTAFGCTVLSIEIH
jgi:hypothetical protein